MKKQAGNQSEVRDISGINSFTIRVYGILMDNRRRVLVSDEYIRGHYFTKFPGGGMEFGEGTRECLKREFKEETNLDVEVGEHLYTTDYYQVSAFNTSQQIMAIYYLVKANEPIRFVTKEIPFDFEPSQTADPNGQSEVLRWIHWDDLTPDDVHLPIDKIVVGLLKENYTGYGEKLKGL